MSATAKQRDYSFDIAKGIAIYLVDLGHIVTISTLRIPIDFIHMPLFFFVSGWFFTKTFENDKPDGLNQAKRKAQRLLLPFLVWSFIALLFNLALWVVSGGLQTGAFGSYAAGQVVDIFVHVRSFWFLLVLFLTLVYMLLCRALARKIPVNRYVLAIAGWILLYIFVPDNHESSVFGLYKFEWLFPLFVAGCLLKDSDIAEKAKLFYSKHKWASRASLMIAVALTYVCFSKPLFDLWGVPNVFAWGSPLTGLGVIVYYFLSFFGVVALLVLSGRLAKTRACKWLSELGIYSLDIYVLHMFLVKAFLMVVPESLVNSALGSYLIAPLFSLVVVVVIWAAVKFVFNRFKPYVALMRE